MATLPLGISVGVDGAAQAISTLGKIARNTRRINAGTIALGVGSIAAFRGAAKFATRLAKQALASGAELAASARAGEEVAARFTDAGLAGAEALNNRMNELRDTVMAAFINATPNLMYYFDVAKARVIQFEGVAVDAFKIIQKNWPEFFSTLGLNVGIFFKWFGENWKDIAINAGKMFVSVITNSFKNIMAIVDAFRQWITTGKFDVKLHGLLEGADLIDIKGPEFLEVPGLSDIADAFSARQNEADLAIEAAKKNRDDLLNATVRGGKVSEDKAQPTKFSSALIRGSVEEASARVQAQAQNEQLRIQREQLAEQRKTTKAVESFAGTQIIEARIA